MISLEAIKLSHSISLFPGAMGPDGYISCFDHLISEHALKRKLILKGGPGVGKSTFMRRVHAALCENDEASTLCFCSGDPDSLDAVVIAHKGLLILDGTAPHVVDPRIPGARDSIINLGQCLHEEAMRPRLKHIKAVMEDHAACTRRATACLRAAKPLIEDSSALVASAMDKDRFGKMTHTLIDSILGSMAYSDKASSLVRPIITTAVTPKGEICLLCAARFQRIIRLTGHPSMDFTPVLRALSSAAQSKGLCVEEHLDTLVPGRLRHISLPQLSLLITTSPLQPSEQIFDFSACIPSGGLLRHECALEAEKTQIDTLIKRASAALAEAKLLHDELETFYVPNMDFSRWQEMLDETISSLRK